MEKNNLDNLFRDNLKDFKEAPDDNVWNEIEASLDKKRKKRIIPIWWKLGGVAALVAVLFYVVNPFNTNGGTEKIIITDTQNATSVDDNNDSDEDVIPSVTDENTIETTEITSASDEKSDPSLINTEKSLSTKSNKNSPLVTNKSNNRERQILVAENEISTSKKEKGNESTLPINQQEVVIDSKNKTVADQSDKKSSLESSEINRKNLVEPDKKNTVAEAVVEKDEKKKSIYDAIAEQNKEEEKFVTEKSESRWAMGPSVAPVYFDAQGQGSPIHSNFASNTKSGNVNLSYGLQVSYGVSKKLSIRTGVHKVDFGYDTNDVVFSSSLQASTNDLIDNINYSQASRNLVVESKSRTETALSDNSTSSEFNAASASLEGRMVQQMGYLEVPFELNYALVDKKLGINVIGGVSSLFLIDNSVSLESEGLVTEMGQANNLNDVNFSTNIGLGFNYEFSQKVQLNLEPVFKYQLNTFSETAGQFRPYTIGVYSGISFKF